MNKHATVRVHGNAGVGRGREHHVRHAWWWTATRASRPAPPAAAACVVIRGDASARCGISMKGVDIVVHGSVGHMSAFMAQKGRLVVCGDAGDALGDSIYEARLYVRGAVAGLGADCVEKEMRDEHRRELGRAARARPGSRAPSPSQFRRYGSARRLYNFDVDNAGSVRMSELVAPAGGPGCASRRSSTAT